MNLDKKLLMLIHGSADETVHYQHSMMLIRALTEKGILFRHQVRCFYCLRNTGYYLYRFCFLQKVKIRSERQARSNELPINRRIYSLNGRIISIL